MLKLYVKFQNALQDERGQDMVEYALMLSLIAAGTITAVGTIAAAITTAYTTLTTNLSGAL
jgi:Flp pilus assembly pilin Flp